MWKTHHISIETEVPLKGQKAQAALVRKVIREALTAEEVSIPCEVNVLFTNDVGIQEINSEQRQFDAPTDVLSFPMLDLVPGEALTEMIWADPGTGLTVLGDMVLSVDRVKEQAQQYGHSERRELCYLVVHSILHLLGYDHLDEGPDKVLMRQREEVILSQLGITRKD
jgi:probable rRNA maturation factor